MRDQKYLKFRDKETRRKIYRGLVRKPTATLYPKQLCNKRHNTATEAAEYARQVEARWVRLLQAKESDNE